MWGNNSKQKQILVSAYELEVIQKAFNSTLSWLEFYIENSDYSGNWQRQTEPIKREDLAQSGRIRGFMETALLALDNVIENKPNFIAKKFQDQFYSWLDKSGINVDDCSEELTQSLLDIYNVLNNQGKEFAERTSNEAGENISRMTPEERRRNFYNTFIASQKMMEVAKARQKELEGKTYKDIEIKNPFTGNPDQGKKLFGQIKGQQTNTNEMEGIENSAQSINWNLIIELSESKNDWEVKLVVISHNYVSGRWYQGQPEQMLIHRTAKIEYNQSNGDLIIQPRKMYKIKDFNDGERAELEQIFGSFQTVSTASHGNQKTSFYLKKQEEVLKTAHERDNEDRKGKIFGILGMVSVLAITGIVVVKKKLNKKVKKV